MNPESTRITAEIADTYRTMVKKAQKESAPPAPAVTQKAETKQLNEDTRWVKLDEYNKTTARDSYLHGQKMKERKAKCVNGHSFDPKQTTSNSKYCTRCNTKFIITKESIELTEIAAKDLTPEKKSRLALKKAVYKIMKSGYGRGRNRDAHPLSPRERNKAMDARIKQGYGEEF